MGRVATRSRWLLLAALGVAALMLLGGVAVWERGHAADAPPATAGIELTTGGGVRSGSFSYVVVNGGFRVYDIRKDHALVKSVTFPDAAAYVDPRGVAAEARSGRLYASYRGGYRGEQFVAYDLLRDRVLWTRNVPVDSFALTTDGRKIYAACGESRDDCDHWWVLDAKTGAELGRIPMHVAAHNTIASLDGERVFLASAKHDQLAVVDPETDEIIDWIGPFRDSIRPFTVNRDRSLVFVTVDFLSGFQVASAETGTTLYTAEVEGFPVAREEFPTLPITQSHGIALTPDETEVWVADDVYDHLHVFDVRGLPGAPPRQIADIPLGFSPKWINFTRDGRYAHVSTGEIVDRRTRTVVALVEPSRQYVQIDWKGGRPIRAYSRYGLGYEP